MNWHRQVAILIFGTTASGTLAQSVPGMHLGALLQPEPVMQATVCDIVNNPGRFEATWVRIRAQIWSDTVSAQQFWMNEVTMRSGKVCEFLRTRISGPTRFAGANGFGTFTGRLVRESAPLSIEGRGSKERLVFIVEKESDVYGIQYRGGPNPPLQLYDKQTAAFIKPDHTVHVDIRCGEIRLVPGTSAYKVSCFGADLPVDYDTWSTTIFRPDRGKSHD